ncbi:carbamoyltransferase C-terminal domain-containing protein [Streptomyces sp. NPDC051704]|uniref:carbamoyltransferase C-terminal domain-containing protein n=1 Tax=Streptomyces sp. NPDC051704 TaxID=3365671 RepID=UPI0037A79ADF
MERSSATFACRTNMPHRCGTRSRDTPDRRPRWPGVFRRTGGAGGGRPLLHQKGPETRRFGMAQQLPLGLGHDTRGYAACRRPASPRGRTGRADPLLLAPATDVRTRDRLNEVKGRAGYRPVAPICLTERAPEVFSPGTPDPYMLFEHRVRPEWADRVPAVVHLDGTARLQTVDSDAGTPVSKVLTAYERLTGIPVLCNTSANMNGRGFFPDVATAAEWGRLNHIWCDGTLCTKADRATFTD